MRSDQSRRYGVQYAGVYDLVFARDGAAEETADMIHALAGAAHPDVVELGVGTGRIALPLVRRGARVTGVDTSPELLELAREAALLEELPVRLLLADMRAWTSDVPADIVYCVCGTISMLETEQEQLRVLERAASSTAPGGHVVVETHNPAKVRALHAERTEVDVPVPVDGLVGGLVMHSTLGADAGLWQVTSSWQDQTGARTAEEFSRLTPPGSLADLAAAAGLEQVALAADFAGSPLLDSSPCYVSTFVKPAVPASPRPKGTQR